jgi:superfamily II DNA or RNA helicase
MDFTGLLEPQKQHSMNLLNSIYLNGVADDFSDLGTGKTYVACWIAKQLNCPVVVICPSVVKSSWKETLALFGIHNPIIINYELLVRGNTQYLNYDLTKFHQTPKWWLSEGINVNFRQDSFIIVDEQHRGRGVNSLTADLLIVLKNQKYKILGLSATAATSVADMKAFGYKANLHNGENYLRWCRDHGARVNRYGTIDWNASQIQAQEGIRRIRENLFDLNKTASRMRREDFGDIFPENHVVAEAFDLGSNTKKLQHVYDLMQTELAALDEKSKDYSQHHFAIMIKARRNAELLKIPAMIDMFEDWYDEGVNPVIFVNFTDSVLAIKKKLEQNKKFNKMIGLIVGNQSDTARKKEIDLFQKNKTRGMIVNIKAGGLGVSLHDITGDYKRYSIISPTWSAFDMVQATGRINRAKGKSITMQKIFFAANTLEVRICSRVNLKIKNIETLNDGDLAI